MAEEPIRILAEGEYINKYLQGRFSKNKNAIFVVTGATGSGKTYACLRICELWYSHFFNDKFPTANICFSVNEIVKRLKEGNLRRGELLVLEEGGANLGSLDFQNKLSKLFTYILQSFRSMNIGLLINLPVLSMLNKQARLLLHIHMITNGIDFFNKECELKCLNHQLNQHTGKSYWKYPRIMHGGRSVKVETISYRMPSQDLLWTYEKRKSEFVGKLVADFEDNTNGKEKYNKEANERRQALIDKLEKNKKGKIICIKCKSGKTDVLKDKVSCRGCGYVHYLEY